MIEFTSRYSLLISLILLAAAAFSSYFFYRKSSLPITKRNFLIVLKAAGIFLLLFLFIEPSILAVLNANRKPLSIVLVDGTRSNNLPFNNKPKSIQVKDLVSRLDIFSTAGDNLRVYEFSSADITPEKTTNPDSLTFDGYETNPAAALEHLRGRFPEDIYKSIVIISDGIFNSGGNPLNTARTFQCPVITIGIGDTIQQKDVVIRRVTYNEKAFTESTNEVRVELSAFGFMGQRADISLLREGTVISAKTVNINDNNWTGEVLFETRETEPGIIRYRIAAENKPEEITFMNNHNDFLVKYLQNKTRILYISGGPSYDNAVISRILKRIRNYEVTIKTVKSASDFYEGPLDFRSYGELSAVVLQGFPVPQFNSEAVSQLADRINTLSIPLITLADKNTDYKKLEMFDESVPFTIGRPGSGESSVSVQSTQTAGSESRDIFKDLKSLPPLIRNVSSVIQKPGSEVLLIDKSSGEPILLTRNTEKIKSAAFLGYGFWKWRLSSGHDFETSIEQLLTKIIYMSLIKDRKTKLTIVPKRDVFDYSEKSKFSAEVYDDDFNRVQNAKIKAKIYSGRDIIRSDLEFKSTGNSYLLDAGVLPTGDYRIEAVAEVNGNFFAKDETRFVVDTLKLEYETTRSNFENLKLLSDNTGGKFFAAFENSDSIDNYIKSRPDNSGAVDSGLNHVRINLWQDKYILLSAIFLFSLEWIIRKRNNIA